MAYDPKIFIRDYGNPDYRILLYSHQFALSGAPLTFERHLIKKLLPLDGDQHILLEGGAQVSGNDALLTELGNPLLLDNPNSYNFDGSDIKLIRHKITLLTSGSYTVSGADIPMVRHVIMGAEVGTFSVSGPNLKLVRHRVMKMGLGSYSLLERDLNLNADKPVLLEGDAQVSGSDVLLLEGAAQVSGIDALLLENSL